MSHMTWQIANSVINKDKSALPPLYSRLEVLFFASDKANLFSENFFKNSNLDGSGSFLPAFLSRINQRNKLHNIPITTKFVKVITNLDSSEASGPDCIPMFFLKNCKPEFSLYWLQTLQYMSEGILSVRLLKRLICGVCTYKCRKRSSTKNYGPVSPLSVVNKIFKKLVHDRLIDHLKQCDLFSDFL